MVKKYIIKREIKSVLFAVQNNAINQIMSVKIDNAQQVMWW